MKTPPTLFPKVFFYFDNSLLPVCYRKNTCLYRYLFMLELVVMREGSKLIFIYLFSPSTWKKSPTMNSILSSTP